MAVSAGSPRKQSPLSSALETEMGRNRPQFSANGIYFRLAEQERQTDAGRP
jgi:hypothetical protein